MNVLRKVIGKPALPRVVHAGNAILRKPCQKVPNAEIVNNVELTALVDSMIAVMRKHGGCGLAAPQVGVPKQIFVYELTAMMIQEEKHFRNTTLLDMKPVPLTVVINPIITLGKRSVVHREGCLSIPGYSAHVPRAIEAKVTAVNMHGEEIVLPSLSEWHARILQHECDHLSGKLYIDCMQCRSFAHDEERLRHVPDPNDVVYDGACHK